MPNTSCMIYMIPPANLHNPNSFNSFCTTSIAAEEQANTIYTKYKQLTKKQRQQLLTALQSQSINIVKIEAYEYADVPGIKHLFFYFAEDSRKAIPYFMLDSEVWEKIFQLVSLTHSGHYIL